MEAGRSTRYFLATTKRNFISLGEQLGSQDTLAQADQTLSIRPRFAALLARHDFAAPDRDRLVDARDPLIEAGVGRDAGYLVHARQRSSRRAVVDDRGLQTMYMVRPCGAKRVVGWRTQNCEGAKK